MKGLTGYKIVAFELSTLARVLRESWTEIAGKSAITVEELDRAEALGDELMVAVGLRDNPPATVAKASDDRQRAFTLFANAYDTVRQGVTFLRWKKGDDVDALVPSLYVGHGGRKKQTGAQKDAAPATPATPPAAVSPVAPPAPAAKSAESYPGGSPFSS